MSKQWFVVTTKHEKDAEAAANLRAQGYGVHLSKRYERVEQGKRIEARARLRFPGYLFVAFDAGRDQHGPIGNTRGVDELLLNGKGDPQPIPAGVVETLRWIEDEEYAKAATRKKPVPRDDLRSGDAVQIDRRDHPAHGLIGEFVAAIKGVASVFVGRRVVSIAECDLKPVKPEKKAA